MNCGSLGYFPNLRSKCQNDDAPTYPLLPSPLRRTVSLTCVYACTLWLLPMFSLPRCSLTGMMRGAALQSCGLTWCSTLWLHSQSIGQLEFLKVTRSRTLTDMYLMTSMRTLSIYADGAIYSIPWMVRPSLVSVVIIDFDYMPSSVYFTFEI